MTIKEKIQIMINIHTRVVTGVFLFLCVYLFWLPGNASIAIRDVLGIQIIGLISAVGNLPLLTEKELSKTRMITYNICYFLLINVSVLVMAYLFHWANFKNVSHILAIEAMVIATYSLVKFIFYRIDSNEANKINEKLKLRNKKIRDLN